MAYAMKRSHPSFQAQGTSVGFAAFVLSFSNNSTQISFVRPFHPYLSIVHQWAYDSGLANQSAQSLGHLGMATQSQPA